MPRDRCTTSKLRLRRHFARWRPATIWLASLYLAFATTLPAQERVRSAGLQLPIQTFKRSPEAFVYLGPFQEVLNGSIGVRYTDNVNLSDSANKVSDLSFALGMALDTTWVISHLNQLQFNFGGAIVENFYGNGRNKLTLEVDPNSKVQFKFAIGDTFQVTLYDQFSYQQNPTTDPTATDTANLNSLTNTIGTVIEADLNVALLSLSVDYSYNTQSGQNVEGQENPTTTGTRDTFRIGPAVTFRWSPTITYGINATATRSISSDSPNVDSLNFGPFITGKLGRDFEFDLAAGGTLVETNPSVPPSYYYSLIFRYQLTHHTQLVFSGSHDLIFTTATDLTEENLFRLGAQFKLTRLITLSLSPFVNFGTVKTTTVGNVDTGDYTLFGIEVGVDWRIRKRWSAGITYDYVRRESGATFGTGTSASNNYIQNTWAIALNYSF